MTKRHRIRKRRDKPYEDSDHYMRWLAVEAFGYDSTNHFMMTLADGAFAFVAASRQMSEEGKEALEAVIRTAHRLTPEEVEAIRDRARA